MGHADLSPMHLRGWRKDSCMFSSCLCSSNQKVAAWVQVVPEGLRSSIYAFDRCFEGAISALSAPLVGLVAERWFHYEATFHGSTPQQQLSNATALGDGLLVRNLPSSHVHTQKAL